MSGTTDDRRQTAVGGQWSSVGSVFILAGGLGTRLRAVSGDRPKALMPIGGQPFVRRLLVQLAAQNLRDCVLCLSYGAQAIQDYFSSQPIEGVSLHYSIEPEPRGTAGALRVAQAFWAEHNLILNGDTEVTFDFHALLNYHLAQKADVTIGLAHVADTARYGRVIVGEHNRVHAFAEKAGQPGGGLVNVGVYLATRRTLNEISADGRFSIEREWLPDLLSRDFSLFGLVVAAEFTDIGTPEDYWRLTNQA